VKQAFSRIGGLDLETKETAFGESEFYRNKVQYPFSVGKNGECIFGYYARHSHRIIGHSGCMLQDGIFEEIASFCAENANELRIKPYDESTGMGVLRHIVMRKNRIGEVLVCIVAKEKDKKLPELGKRISERFKNVVGVHLNLNRRRDNVIFGDKTEKIVGRDVLTDTLCGKTFEISPRSFYQVNAPMAERLYERARDFVPERSRPSVILDLYCGAGTIGICVAKETDKLCGVEIIDSAVENAKKNAQLNGRTDENTLFVCGDASVGVEECKKRFGKPDVIIVDPPRKGLDRAVIDTVVNASPERVIYISCDPATLARDCKIFAELGYTTNQAEPFDLFPRTGHVETVVLLERAVSSI
jgi:23S rRNA (uracil1939-C5)-methyltransferase